MWFKKNKDIIPKTRYWICESCNKIMKKIYEINSFKTITWISKEKNYFNVCKNCLKQLKTKKIKEFKLGDNDND